MSRKRKVISIIIAIDIIIIVVCIVIQNIMNEETKILEKEEEKLEELIITTNSGQKIETEYMKIEENTFFIKIPTTFKKLDEETIKQKYSGDIPGVVFSNNDITVNIAINMTENEILNEEIDEYKTYMLGLLEENNAQIINSNYYKIDEHNIGQIKMINNTQGYNLYNNIIFFSYNNKLIVITFSCVEELQEEWQGVGDFIIESLFIQ